MASARIIGINPGGVMSTIWEFQYITPEGGSGTFYADHRPAKEMCEGLYEFALAEITRLSTQVPDKIRENKGLLVTFVNVDLVPDETMGLDMPRVKPVSVDTDRLVKLVANIKLPKE